MEQAKQLNGADRKSTERIDTSALGARLKYAIRSSSCLNRNYI
jgi:hypothetical protein